MTEKSRPTKLLTINKFNSLKEDVSMEIIPHPTSPNKKNSKAKDELSLQRDFSDVNLVSARISPRSVVGSPKRSLARSNTKAKISSLLDPRDDIVGNLKSATKLKKNSKAVRLDIDNKNTSIGETEENTKPAKKQSDYTSLLMYVPQNMTSFSAKNSNAKSFLSFGELAKTTKTSHSRLLQGILKENDEFKFKGDETTPADRIELMKKVLDFNQKQKNHYVKQLQAEKKHVLLPLIKQVQNKTKKNLHVKVLPSRKLMEEQAAALMDGQAHAHEDLPMGFFYRSSAPSSPMNSARKRDASSDKTPSNLKQTEIRVEEQAFSITYRVFCNYNPTGRAEWRPDVREGHSFTTVGKYVILYGGLSNYLLDEIAVYDPTRNLWVKPKMNGDVPKLGRHGHTACEFNKQLVIFGGEQQFNTTLHIRDCLNDVHLYNLDKSEWKYIKPPSNNLQPRRYHTAAVFDKSMYIYGGINNEGIYMRDLWTLNLRTYVWEKIDISSDRENGIAFHTMTACYVDKNSHNKDRDKLKVPEEGLYVFGGKDGQGKVLNTIKIFNMDTKNPQWKYPTVKGVPPTPRYNHSTLFYAPLGLLVVYGGKNDHLYGSTNNICLNDIRIFNLEHFAWASTSTHGDTSRVGRCLHAVAGHGSKMLIFGGVEFCQYANDEVVTIELSQSKVKKILDMDNQGDTTTFDNHKKSYSKLPRSRQRNRSENNYYEVSAEEEYGIRPIVSFLPMPKVSDGDRSVMNNKINASLSREKSSSNLSKTKKSGDFSYI